MIKEGIYINGIYQHYKGAHYRVTEVANYHDKELPSVVLYHKCDKNGLFLSIRLDNGDIIRQPFYRFINDFKAILPPSRNNVERFKFIKQL